MHTVDDLLLVCANFVFNSVYLNFVVGGCCLLLLCCKSVESDMVFDGDTSDELSSYGVVVGKLREAVLQDGVDELEVDQVVLKELVEMGEN